MKKYKHKQTGYIAQQCADMNYQLLRDIEYNTNIPKEVIENSNDWEEVVKQSYEIKDYEILETRISNNLQQVIWKVKRLSDDEVFTVGDLISARSYKYIKIEFIKEKDGIELWGRFNNGMLGYALLKNDVINSTNF